MNDGIHVSCDEWVGNWSISSAENCKNNYIIVRRRPTWSAICELLLGSHAQMFTVLQSLLFAAHVIPEVSGTQR